MKKINSGLKESKQMQKRIKRRSKLGPERIKNAEKDEKDDFGPERIKTIAENMTKKINSGRKESNKMQKYDENINKMQKRIR